MKNITIIKEKLIVRSVLDNDDLLVDIQDIGGVSLFTVNDQGEILASNIKAGATQLATGAVLNELWKTSGHATLPDNVIMIGI